MRFKDQNAQEQKIYTKHSMDLRNGGIEFLLVFEESCETVVVWCGKLEIDALWTSK
jgi:hypothetical protein